MVYTVSRAHDERNTESWQLTDSKRALKSDDLSNEFVASHVGVGTMAVCWDGRGLHAAHVVTETVFKSTIRRKRHGPGIPCGCLRRPPATVLVWCYSCRNVS